MPPRPSFSAPPFLVPRWLAYGEGRRLGRGSCSTSRSCTWRVCLLRSGWTAPAGPADGFRREVRVATPSSTRVVLAALVIVGALTVALFVWAPGRSAPVAVGEPAAAGEAPGKVVIAATVDGTGAITGEALLVGNPPPMQPLKLGADPVCAGGSRVDEQVIVSNGRLANVLVRLLGAPAEQPPNVVAGVDQRSGGVLPPGPGVRARPQLGDSQRQPP